MLDSFVFSVLVMEPRALCMLGNHLSLSYTPGPKCCYLVVKIYFQLLYECVCVSKEYVHESAVTRGSQRECQIPWVSDVDILASILVNGRYSENDTSADWPVIACLYNDFRGEKNQTNSAAEAPVLSQRWNI